MHQNAQRLLEPLPVVVPYAELLTFPSSWLRTRRDNLRLLNLIEAMAFLHQQQRPHKRLASGAEYIEATVEDYAIAYAIASSVLGSGFDELRKPARDLLAVIEAKLHELAETRGTQPSSVWHHAKATVRRALYSLGSFFGWAVRWGLVGSNPVARVVVPRRARVREIRALSKRERAVLIAAADRLAQSSRRKLDAQAPTLVRLMLKTGPRAWRANSARLAGRRPRAW